MGIIKAVLSAAGGALADQWLEVIEPNDMGEHTVFTLSLIHILFQQFAKSYTKPENFNRNVGFRQAVFL